MLRPPRRLFYQIGKLACNHKLIDAAAGIFYPTLQDFQTVRQISNAYHEKFLTAIIFQEGLL